MLLSELLKGIDTKSNFNDTEITDITDNTAKLCEGCVFVCIKGAHFDGHSAAEEAVNKGARAVVAEYDTGVENQILVKNTRDAYSLLCANFYGNPSEKLHLIGITGTNGKTTTTALLGKIMSDTEESVFVVGNIGNPYTSIALQTREDSVIVAEMSSFQLETIQTFRPRVSAILNITPDHLNRHHTMEAYIEAKENIAKNQTEKDTCVLNYEDDVTRAFGENVKSKVLYFSSQRILEEGIYLENGQIVLAMNGEKTPVCHVDELNILGTHNHENAMAAVGMAAAYGVPVDVIRRTLKEFQGVEHRIEYVAEKNGVVYYNDSKGTNPVAAIKGIQAMNRPTVLIGGGYDKDSAYDEWIDSFDGKVKKLVLLGATRDKIAETARAHGFEDIEMADTFEEAFAKCVENAKPGDAVLLSPACASWGMFKNYEERGDKFKELVNNL